MSRRIRSNLPLVRSLSAGCGSGSISYSQSYKKTPFARLPRPLAITSTPFRETVTFFLSKAMLRSLFLVATLALGALSAPSPKRFRCGSVNPPAELVSAVQGLEAATRAGTGPVQRQQALVVNLYFHIVSTAVAAGTVTSGQIRNQVRNSRATARTSFLSP